MSGFEARQTAAISEALEAAENELYEVALRSNPHFPDTSAATTATAGEDEDVSKDGDASMYDDSPEAAVARWYSTQERASKPPYEEWTSAFPFLRVIGTSIQRPADFVVPSETADVDADGLSSNGRNDGRDEVNEDGEIVTETIASHCELCDVEDNALRTEVRNRLLDDLEIQLHAVISGIESRKSDEVRKVRKVTKYAVGKRGGV
jgi:hypothetical protein